MLMILIAVLSFAVSKHEFTYVGGTTSALLKDASGTIKTDDHAALHFQWESSKGFGDWTLPYDKIIAVSYSQHLGRGLGSNIALGVSTLGTVPMLSKKRRHFVTIEFLDAQGQRQTAAFEVGKGAIRDLLSSIEVRTGKKVIHEDYESEERKTASK